jgi:hypothetical protein
VYTLVKAHLFFVGKGAAMAADIALQLAIVPVAPVVLEKREEAQAR